MSVIKSLRLKTGELVAAKLDADYTIADFAEREKYITLHDPVVYVGFKFLDPESNQVIETISMSPFNGISDDRAIVIEANNILFISEMRDGAKERYHKFLSQLVEYNKLGDETMDDMIDDDADPDPLDMLSRMMPPDKGIH